jgi:hypothetical protein
MQITIHPTSKIVELEVASARVPARVWEGVTEDGIRVNLFVTRVVPILGVDDPGQEQFQKALQEVEPPSATANAWPTRLAL